MFKLIEFQEALIHETACLILNTYF